MQYKELNCSGSLKTLRVTWQTLKHATRHIQNLEGALERAITGLEWWMDEYPEKVSPNDYEVIESFRQLLQRNDKDESSSN